mmetsp:Transcript_74774/g.200420  ORF Transcript_74774/g.200420 Transcript_74774/m.200420 type:complete len:454 (+) Transcript_74774:1920-3281(+)
MNSPPPGIGPCTPNSSGPRHRPAAPRLALFAAPRPSSGCGARGPSGPALRGAKPLAPAPKSRDIRPPSCRTCKSCIWPCSTAGPRGPSPCSQSPSGWPSSASCSTPSTSSAPQGRSRCGCCITCCINWSNSCSLLIKMSCEPAAASRAPRPIPSSSPSSICIWPPTPVSSSSSSSSSSSPSSSSPSRDSSPSKPESSSLPDPVRPASLSSPEDDDPSSPSRGSILCSTAMMLLNCLSSPSSCTLTSRRWLPLSSDAAPPCLAAGVGSGCAPSRTSSTGLLSPPPPTESPPTPVSILAGAASLRRGCSTSTSASARARPCADKGVVQRRSIGRNKALAALGASGWGRSKTDRAAHNAAGIPASTKVFTRSGEVCPELLPRTSPNNSPIPCKRASRPEVFPESPGPDCKALTSSITTRLRTSCPRPRRAATSWQVRCDTCPDSTVRPSPFAGSIS